GANQQWQSIALSSGFSALLNRGSGKALDVVNGSTAAGALIQQYTFVGGANQQWSLVRIAQ
ncbi:MAG: RICIN domain-containing protein, partial [Bryobacteraceae bacterium]